MDRVRGVASSVAKASRRSSDWFFDNATALASRVRRVSTDALSSVSPADAPASAAAAANELPSAPAEPLEPHEQERIDSLLQLNSFLLESFPWIRALHSQCPPWLSPSGLVLALALSAAAVFVYFTSLAALLKLLGFIGPAYMTFLTVETDDEPAHVEWLRYWAVFGLSLAAEPLWDALLGRRSWYGAGKVLYYFWLVSPWTDGASLVYNWVFEPLYRHQRHRLHGGLRALRSGALQVTNEVRQVSTKLLGNAAASFVVGALQSVSSQSSQSSQSSAAATPVANGRGGPTRTPRSLEDVVEED